MNQHYFIGIPMPETIYPIAKNFQEQLRLRDYYKAIPHPEDLHITLLFIGAFPDDKIPTMKELLSRIAKETTSFTIEVNGVSSFGSNRTPRVIYLSVEDHPVLNRLNQDIVSTAGQLLQQPKKERFTPHVTIAKKWKDVNGFQFEKQSFDPIQVEVDSFNLFAIHPSSTPKYKAVEVFRLEGK